MAIKSRIFWRGVLQTDKSGKREIHEGTRRTTERQESHLPGVVVSLRLQADSLLGRRLLIYRGNLHRCTGYTGFGFGRLQCPDPGHPQPRVGSSRRSASCAATLRPVNPVHPVHRCSKNNDPRYRSGVPPPHQSATPRQGRRDPVLSPTIFPSGAGSRCTVYFWVTGMQKVSASSQAK